jgi:cell division protein FtsX
MSLFGRAKARVMLVVALAGLLALSLVGSAFATGPEYDIKPTTESLKSELVANLPTVLAIVGALVALTIAVRAIRKFVHV